MDEKKLRLFESDPIPKAVATLALPAVASTLVMILYNIADTFFVGMLKDSVESAAVSLAAAALLAFNAVNNLFGVGSASMISRSLGRKDYDTARRTAAFSFWMAAICSLLISVGYLLLKEPVLKILGTDSTTAAATARYLYWTVAFGAPPAILNVVLSNMIRAEGSSKAAGIGVISGCVLNIILDPFFVLPQFLGMGAEGAGLATFISNSFATLFLIGYTIKNRRTSYIKLDPRNFTVRRHVVKEVFGVGVPASIQNLLNVTGMLILNNFTAEFGADAVSAMGISHKAAMLPMYVTMGFTQGIMPLISYNYAGGDRRRMKDATMFALRFTMTFSLVCAAAYYAFAPQIIRAFLDEAAVVAHGGKLLRAMSLGIPFLGLDFSAVAVFQATGKGRYSLFFAISRKILLEIPAVIIFNKLSPLYGMGYSQPFAELVLAAAACFMLRKIFRETPDAI